MSDEGPLRRAPGDARGTGWKLVRQEGPSTRFERPGRRDGARLLLIFPAVISVTCVAWMLGVEMMLSIGALFIVVLALWPRRVEQLDVRPRRFIWRDRLFGARVRVRPPDVGFSLRPMEDQAALVMIARRTEHLLADGTSEDVQAFLEELHDAIERAQREA